MAAVISAALASGIALPVIQSGYALVSQSGQHFDVIFAFPNYLASGIQASINSRNHLPDTMMFQMGNLISGNAVGVLILTYGNV